MLLANFEHSVKTTSESDSGHDLEDLGSAILECMNGSSSEHLRDRDEVRRLRKQNKMFGLANGEAWSGHKLLVDFLDHMFNGTIAVPAKLENPVSEIARCTARSKNSSTNMSRRICHMPD